MMSGKAAYVLPSFNNTPYISINEGEHFLLVDIVGSAFDNKFDFVNWYQNKNLLECQFTI